MGWLAAPVEQLLEVALVGELTVVGSHGRPITHPLIPLYSDGRTAAKTAATGRRKTWPQTATSNFRSDSR